jgi:hypothetical protein
VSQGPGDGAFAVMASVPTSQRASRKRGTACTIEDYTPDQANSNRGAERGRGMLEHSLRTYGAGRSILVDRNGITIAGNKTLEVAAELGLSVREVETDGHELVVVRRSDLDLARDPRARELAYADNRVGQVDLDWDAQRLLDDVAAGLDLGVMFSEKELAALQASIDHGVAEADAESVKPMTREEKTYKLEAALSFEDSLIVKRAVEEVGGDPSAFVVRAAEARLRGTWS